MIAQKVILSIVLIILLLSFPLRAAQESSPPDVEEIVKTIDELYRSRSSYAELEMQIATPHWERTLKMSAWTEAMSKTFIRISAPPKEEGVATLRVGSEMWNYLPKTNKVMKIPPSMMMSSWMGSDFTNDDLVREFTFLDDYHYRLISPEDAEEGLHYIQFIPKEGLPIVWGKVVIAVRSQDYIPVWEKYYDEKGKLMRVMNFKDIREFDGREIPSILELIPQTKQGHKTVIRYLKIKFNEDLSSDVFTLRNLRSRR